jgi:hypothetical protein
MNIRIPVFILFVAMSGWLLSQDDLKNESNILNNKFRPGVKLSFHINYPVFHLSPTISFYYKNHNIFLGVEVSNFMGDYRKADFRDTYVLNNPGIRIGWRYLTGPYEKPNHVFFQLDASYYTGEYSYQSPGGGGGAKNRIIEPGLGFGGNFRLASYFELFAGTGIAVQISDRGHFSHGLFRIFFGMAFFYAK